MGKLEEQLAALEERRKKAAEASAVVFPLKREVRPSCGEGCGLWAGVWAVCADSFGVGCLCPVWPGVLVSPPQARGPFSVLCIPCPVGWGLGCLYQFLWCVISVCVCVCLTDLDPNSLLVWGVRVNSCGVGCLCAGFSADLEPRVMP